MKAHAPNDYIILPVSTGHISEMETSLKIDKKQEDESAQSPIRRGESSAADDGKVCWVMGALVGCVEVIV